MNDRLTIHSPASGTRHSRRLLPGGKGGLLSTLAVVAWLCLASLTHAADASDHVWLISTRAAPHCGDLDATPHDFHYCRLDEDGQWLPADAATFQATDDATRPTVVFIHGNRTDAEEAVCKAWYVYESIRAETACRPFRYVIWSWPAERVYRRNSDDVRLKADYSDVESYYLAQWLDGLRPDARVSLIGHSFGPRIIAGALHLLAGGDVADRSLPESTVAEWMAGKRNPVRAVFLAAATDADWLAPDGCYGLALPLFDRLLVTRNGCDRVLRWYPRLYGRGGPQAMGFVGPCGVGGAENVQVIDVSCTVGKMHDWRCYCSASNVRGQWLRYTFLEDLPASEEE